MMLTTAETLDGEWARLARSPEGDRALASWRLAEPAFSRLTTLADLTREDADDDMTEGLVRLAPSDPVAARALLWLALPVVTDLARLIPRSGQRVVDDLLALAWQTIRTYRPTRPGQVLPTITADVRAAYRRFSAIDQPSRSVPFADREDRLPRQPPVAAMGGPTGGPATAALRAAYAEKVIGADDYRAVVRTRLFDEPLDVFAVEEGVSTSTLARRRRRAERILRDRITCTRPRRQDDAA